MVRVLKWRAKIKCRVQSQVFSISYFGIMNGESVADSMYWSATSASIEGANGRHHSRNFTALLTLAFISGSRIRNN